MTLARVAISDLLGMLWSTLVVVSQALDLCPSPNNGDTWAIWWNRKSFLGRSWVIFVWAIALSIVGFVAYKATANTMDYFEVRG